MSASSSLSGKLSEPTTIEPVGCAPPPRGFDPDPDGEFELEHAASAAPASMAADRAAAARLVFLVITVAPRWGCRHVRCAESGFDQPLCSAGASINRRWASINRCARATAWFDR